MKTKRIVAPITEEAAHRLVAGDMVLLTGHIITGRDAVLPKLVELIREDRLAEHGLDLQGAVIFHTGVSGAGIGPTSSNKYDIESSIPELSRAGVRMHVGKGKLDKGTIEQMSIYKAVFVVTPPLSALLSSTVISQRVLAFPELGMEAMHLLEVKDFPVIIAAAHGISLNAGKCFQRSN